MLTIGNRTISLDHAPLVIAEIGVNHDGSVDRAHDLVQSAARAGADAVKFQFFRADLLLAPESPLAEYQRRAGESSAHAMLKRLELDAESLIDLCAHARRLDLEPIVTVFSAELVAEACSFGVSAWKVASPDLIHGPLIDALARTERPIILSTGAAAIDEVERAHRWLGTRPHALLQCVSAYPAADRSAALGAIASLRTTFDLEVGYSDHTLGEETGALAAAAGATILEKHLTWSRGADGPDHAASLEPEMFARYVTAARRAAAMRGGWRKELQGVEMEVRRLSRQSIAASSDLAAGTVLRRDDLTFRRPGEGMPPWNIDAVIGRTLCAPVAQGTIIRAEDLK